MGTFSCHEAQKLGKQNIKSLDFKYCSRSLWINHMPSRVTTPTVDLIEKPMTTFREKLWYFTSDQYIASLLKLGQGDLREEFHHITSDGRVTVPERNDYVPDMSHEGSIWIQNREQFNAIVEKTLTDDMFPLRLCYYSKRDD